MRVISHDGTIDVSYENFAFTITGDYYILAMNTIARVGEIVKGSVVHYSSDVKAKKVHDRILTVNCVTEQNVENLSGVF